MNNRFRFRAECVDDICRAIQSGLPFDRMAINRQVIRGEPVPDCVVTIETAANLMEVRAVFAELHDAHVMLGTVAPADEYTGERIAESEGRDL